MDSELVEDLFDPFRQESEGMSRRFEGTGVGLAVRRPSRAEEEFVSKTVVFAAVQSVNLHAA
jgi:signal transduction histidine kinase